MKTIDLSKTIGLIRFIDGSYRPSNSRSAIKLEALLKEARVVLAGPLRLAMLPSLREIAKKHGYKIMTSIKGV